MPKNTFIHSSLCWRSLAVSLVCLNSLTACGPATGPISNQPISQTQLHIPGLPSLEESAQKTQETAIREVYTWRMVIDLEQAEIFSVKQLFFGKAVTFPINQLREVVVAKEKIQKAQVLDPAEAATLAYDVGRYYSSTGVMEESYQIIREIVQEYVKRRQAELPKLRQSLNDYAAYKKNINDNKVKEFLRQNAAEAAQRKADAEAYQKANPELVKKNPGLAYLKEWQRQLYLSNQAKITEHNRQAAAAAKLAKERAAAGVLKTHLEQTSNPTTAEEEVKTKALSSDGAYSLNYLGFGDFMLEATPGHSLPTLIEMSIEGFNAPVPIPILQKTAQGLPILYITKDSQGSPLVQAGFSDERGWIDLSKPTFELHYNSPGQLALTVFQPDGQHQLYQMSQFTSLSNPADETQVKPVQVGQISLADLQIRQAPLRDLRYELVPDLLAMPPEFLEQLAKDLQ